MVERADPRGTGAHRVARGRAWQVDDQFELYARGENLLDEEYEDVIGYRSAPQAFYVGLRFRDKASK